MEVTIPGRLFGEAYPRLLMERPDLALEQVILLDRVQKERPISPEAHLELEAEGLIRGAHPHHEIADPNLDVTAPSAGIISIDGPTPGLGHQHYVDLVVSVVVERGPVGRAAIEKVPATRTSRGANNCRDHFIFVPSSYTCAFLEGLAVPSSVSERASEPLSWNADHIRSTWLKNVGR